ncbi:zinc finger, CCHC-type containing protein [Tanacetum coccineum]
MDAAAMKYMASNFAKLDKFEGVDFKRWQKNMHFLLSSMSMVYTLTTPIPEDGGDDEIVEQIRKRAKWDNDDYNSLEAKYMAEDASSKKFLVSNFTNYKMIDSRPVMEQYNELISCILWKVYTTKMNMDEADFRHHLRIEESLRMQDSDKQKRNNVVGPSVVNMVEHNNSSRYNDNKDKCKHHDNTKTDPNKKSKVTCWKCGKPGHLKKDCKGEKVGNKANGSGTDGSVDGSTNSLKGQNMFNKSFQVYYVTYVSGAYFVQDDDVAWWVDSGETVHVCKDRCWFKTYESLNDGSILHMGNESTALVHGRGCVDLRFSSGKIVSLFNVLHVPNIRKNLVSSSVLNNCGYKQVIESNKFVLSKHGVFIGFGYLSNQMFRLNIVNDNIASAFMSTSKLNDSILWHARLGHVHFKRMQDMSKDGLIPTFDIDTEKCKTCMLTKITKKPFQDVKRETKVLELIYRTRNEVSNQHSDCFNVEDDPKTFDEAIKSHDVAFLKEEINDKMDSSGTYLYHKTADCYGIHSQSDYSLDVCEDSFLECKFDETGKGVIIFLYVDDMLIFGTEQVQVDLTKEFLPDIAFIVGKLSRYTSNPGTQYWQAIQRVLKYLTKTMDYRLTYIGYPSVLEGYTDASWISNTEDNSSTSSWVFLLGGGAISWASKKQTCC